MPGRPKTPMYEYTLEGMFVHKYETKSEVHKRYYNGEKMPLLATKHFKKLPNGNILFDKRMHRDKIKKLIKAINSKFTTNEKQKTIVMYNLFDERIATFRSPYIANIISNIPLSTITNQLKSSKIRAKAPRTTDFFFKYEENG